MAERLREIAGHLLPARRGRVNPRVVKRKMSGFKVKRDEHRKPVPPQPNPAEAETIAPHWRTATTTQPKRTKDSSPDPQVTGIGPSLDLSPGWRPGLIGFGLVSGG
ncbi:hypothetical protein ACQP1G_21290 [Nocardia sp. CA-107356]|uniref:hypothetical protein n=1 Tax=Nocardia sp. CA-107356 TaxID=3239972 RepID=UPI003D93E331